MQHILHLAVNKVERKKAFVNDRCARNFIKLRLLISAAFFRYNIYAFVSVFIYHLSQQQQQHSSYLLYLSIRNIYVYACVCLFYKQVWAN